MKKIMIAAALAATALTATTASAQSTNLTINTGLNGVFNIGGQQQAFNGNAIFSGVFDYGQISSATGTQINDFSALFTQAGQTGTQNFAIGGGVTGQYSSNTLTFSQGGSIIFQLGIANLIQTSGTSAPATADTTTIASSFGFGGGTANINAGSTGTLLATPSDMVAAAPEPATWAMMIVGFGAVGAGMRRRKSKVTTNVAFA